VLLPSFVFQRRQAFFVRLRVPAEIVSLIGKTHVSRSLGTSRVDEARLRAGERLSSIQRAFAEIRTVAATLRIKTPDDLTILLDEKVWPVDVSAEAVALMPLAVRPALQQRMQTRAQTDAPATRGEAAATAISDVNAHAARMALEEARYQRLSEAVARLETTPPVAPTGFVTPSLPPESAQPWPDFIDRFFADRPSIGERAQISHRQAFREFESLVGPKALVEVNKANVKAFADHLRDRPINRAGREHMSRASIIKMLSHLKGLFGWAMSAGLIATNPADGVQPRSETRVERAGPTRRALTTAELTTLFNSPLFTGCLSRSRRSTPGPNRFQDEPYWFWLLALLTGARTEEIAALPSTLVDVGGTLCLDFRHATKTSAGARLVPVLPALRRLGVERWAANQARRGLGMVQGPNGSDDWSKWLNRYMDAVGLDDPTIVAYSLRHNFRQQLRAADLHPEIVDKIFGHEGEAVGARYGRDLSPEEARLVVQRVKAPVDLAHVLVLP
jgi:integrase